MSRVCKDLDSPIEDFFIICGAIAFVALCVFGIVYAVRWVSYNVRNSQKDNPSVISEEPGGSNQALPEAAPNNEGQQGHDSGDSTEVLEPDGIPHFAVSHVRDGDTIEVLYGPKQIISASRSPKVPPPRRNMPTSAPSARNGEPKSTNFRMRLRPWKPKPRMMNKCNGGLAV